MVGAELSVIVMFPIEPKVGGLFTGVGTVTVNWRSARLLNVPPSSTRTVITAVPLELAAAVSWSLPVLDGLEYVTVGFGTSPGLSEVAVTRRVWISAADPEVIPE